MGVKEYVGSHYRHLNGIKQILVWLKVDGAKIVTFRA